MTQPVCIVTGASRGIGLAVARRFIRTGHVVCGVARDEAALQQAADELASGPKFVPIAGDVSRPADVERVIATAADHGALRVVVNNAGTAPLCDIENMSDADFRAALDTNLAGVFNLTRAAWPLLRTAGGGLIVNISSVASVDPFPGFAVYGACKAWVNLFTQATAQEGKPHGIRVYAVAPGAVETRMLRTHFADYPAEQALAPDDVAAMVAHCCEPAMAHSAGQTVFVRR